jgi:hypothetical protein
MKRYQIYLAVIVLVLASLACQAVGGGSKDTPAAPAATQDPHPQIGDAFPPHRSPQRQNPVTPLAPAQWKPILS